MVTLETDTLKGVWARQPPTHDRNEAWGWRELPPQNGKDSLPDLAQWLPSIQSPTLVTWGDPQMCQPPASPLIGYSMRIVHSSAYIVMVETIIYWRVWGRGRPPT